MSSRTLTAVLVLAAAPGLLAQQGPAVVTLADAIRLAERVQPAIIQAQGSIRNADAQVRSAWGAYIPNVTASSTGGYSFSEGISRTDPVTGQVISGNSSSQSLSLGLSANVDLFTGFRRGADMRAARAQGAAADANLVDARFQSRLTTTQEFLNARSAAELVRVREAGVRRAEEQLKVSVTKLRAGTATRSDSLRSLVTLGNAQVQLLDAERQLAQAEANLGRLVGADGRVGAADDSSFHRVLARLDTAAIRANAEEWSPRVRNTMASVTAARAQVSAARAAYWPSLRLSGNYSYSGNSGNDYALFNQRQVSLTLSWPLFNQFSRERSIITQVSALDAAEATAEDARRQVQATLTAQLAALDAARLRMEITGINLQAAEEDLRVQNERYRLGVATIVEVLTSQETLGQAEADAVNARFDYLRAKAQIEAIIGRPLE